MSDPASPLPDGFSAVADGKLATVVTSLQMLAEVQRGEPEPMAGFDLVHVAQPTTGWYRRLFTEIGEPWLWVSRLQLSPEALAAIITDAEVEIYALRMAGRDCGLVELDFRVPGECELAFFGLTPDQVGRRTGRWMMSQAIARAWSRPIDRFWVHTCTFDHPAALNFYIRSGFVPFRREVEVFDDPRLIGLTPMSAGPHVPVISAAPLRGGETKT